jgi:predicted ArsR family transcriptional regulator
VAGTSGVGGILELRNNSVVKIPSEACRRVAQSLLAQGPATAPELAERLQLTAAGVRRHLDTLESDGLILAGERPVYGPNPLRGRGRPPKVYSISALGRDAFEQAYDDLAVAALQFLQDQGGADAVTAFARARARDMERRYLPLVSQAVTSHDRAKALVGAMNQDGFAATVADTTAAPSGGATAIQICQHNCPVAHVASEFPQLCEMETQAFASLLGTHVTRLATIAHGDGVCTAVVANSPQQSIERIPS